MNKARRAQITLAHKALTDAHAHFSEVLAENKEKIEGIRDDEDEFFDGLSDAAKDSDRGTVATQAFDNLEAAVDHLTELENDVSEKMQEALDSLTSAQGED